MRRRCFEAAPESTHGYDTCCFGKINPNLGSAEDFDRFTGVLKERGLGLLLDLVPNHMSATLSNAWWLDVLENGRESPYARFFDIDWRPANPALARQSFAARARRSLLESAGERKIAADFARTENFSSRITTVIFQ